MTHSFQALGTTWWVEVFDKITPEIFQRTMSTVEDFVSAFEKSYSRFLADSFISQLNHERELKEPDAHCCALLQYGKQLYLRTNTHFNILSGHIQEARGYNAQYSFVPKDERGLQPGNPITDLIITSEKIELKHGNIDLGGYGKGYLLDEVVAVLLKQAGLKYFVVNAGGDIYATSEHGKPIEIILEHPTNPGVKIASTQLLNQAFAASSPFKRYWKYGSNLYTHIISDTPVQTASFIKATFARDADAFATTTLIASPKELEALAQTEQLAMAFFNPTTNQLTGNKLFFPQK